MMDKIICGVCGHVNTPTKAPHLQQRTLHVCADCVWLRPYLVWAIIAWANGRHVTYLGRGTYYGYADRAAFGRAIQRVA